MLGTGYNVGRIHELYYICLKIVFLPQYVCGFMGFNDKTKVIRYTIIKKRIQPMKLEKHVFGV